MSRTYLVSREAPQRRGRVTYPGPWRTGVSWSWSSKPCPYCHERRWSWRTLVRSSYRRVDAHRLQVKVETLKKPYPSKLIQQAVNKPKPTRLCQCIGRIDPRHGP